MKKAFIITLAAVLAALSLNVPASAVTRPAASQIPVGTLVIGTHLIYAAAMTNAVYEAALSSASDSSLNAQQNSIYYKSEFAGGQWLDISSATNIYDLSATSGKFVDNSVIDALTLKFYTMSDGKTYSFATGGLIAVSDIVSPYDPSAQAEMEPIVNNLSALDKDNEDNDAPRAILAGILNGNYRDDYTAYLDRAIASLNSSLNAMRSAGAAIQKQEALSNLISTLDHRRRARSLSRMKDMVMASLNRAGELDLQGLISTMSPVVDELETKIQEHLAAGGDDGAGGDASDGSGSAAGQSESESAKDKLRKDLETRLIDALASGGQSEEADKLLQELTNMNNLDSGVVVSPADELATALEMIEALSEEFIESLSGGAIAELASAGPEDPYALRAAEEKQAAIFENVRLEMQAAIDAAGARMDAKDYESLISDLIVQSRDMEQAVRNDASRPSALAAIEAYKDWLDSEHRKAGEESGEKSEAQVLQIEINGLEEKSKAALDKNDLATADALEREIESKAAQLSALEDDISAKISAAQEALAKLENEAEVAKSIGDAQLAESLDARIGALGAEINALNASLPTDVRTAQGEIARLKQEALEAVGQGNVTDAVAGIENISAFADREPVAALGAVKAIEEAMQREKALFGPARTQEPDAVMEEVARQVSVIIADLRDKASALEAGVASAKMSQAQGGIQKLEQQAKTAAAAGNIQLERSLNSQIEALQSEIKEIEASLPPDALEARGEIERLEREALNAAEQGNASALDSSIEGISALSGVDPACALEALEAINAALQKQAIPQNMESSKARLPAIIAGLRGEVSDLGAYGALAELSEAETAIEALNQEMELAKAAEDNKLAANTEYKIATLEARIKELTASLAENVLKSREEMAELEKKATDAISSGDKTALDAAIEKLSALSGADPVSALGALEAISGALAEQGALSGTGGADFDGALELISQLMPVLSEKAAEVGADDSQRLRELCENMLASIPADIPARIMAVIELDGGKSDKNLLALADEYYAQLPRQKLFDVTVVGGERYVPASILPHYLNVRFLPENNGRFLVTNGAVYYRFIRGGNTAETNAGDLDMASPAHYGGTVAYLPESFIQSQFGLSVLELRHKGTTAVLIDEAGAAKAGEVLAAMEGG